MVFYKVMMAELEKAVRKIPAGKISDNTEVSRRVHSTMYFYARTVLYERTQIHETLIHFSSKKRQISNHSIKHL